MKNKFKAPDSGLHVLLTSTGPSLALSKDLSAASTLTLLPFLASVSTRGKACALWLAFPSLHSWPIKSRLLQNNFLKINLKERRKFLCPQPSGLAWFPEGGREANLSLQRGTVKKDQLLLEV